MAWFVQVPICSVTFPTENDFFSYNATSFSVSSVDALSVCGTSLISLSIYQQAKNLAVGIWAFG